MNAQWDSSTLPVTIMDDGVSVTLVEVANGIDNPVGVTHAGDESQRLFVVEQPGQIVIVKDGIVLNAPYLDIRSLVDFGGEKGLLGLAFHPDYKNNGYFYVNYTRKGDGATVIARYQTLPSSSNQSDPSSAAILIVIAQPFSNHNGGNIAFSPVDGYLYIGMGDGGSGGDPLDNGQNVDTLLGAMLRLDVDNGLPYAIPPDNPFVSKPGLDEIWAIGLRNPWRFSFDSLTGDLYIGDVGQNAWEEVSFQASGTPGGLNFGWRCLEGTHIYDFSGECANTTFTNPIVEYDRTQGRSITGGFVYRGASFPSLLGKYFYADYVSGKVWSVQQASTNPITWTTPKLELETGMNISSFGEDETGELYLAARSQGTIFKLVDVNGPVPNLETSRKQVSSVSADVDEAVTYSIVINNTGGIVTAPVFITDTIPSGLNYIADSFRSSTGTPNDSNLPVLTWVGEIADAPVVTLTYQVKPTGTVTGSIINTAQLSSPAIQPLTLAASLSVPRSLSETTQLDFIIPGSQPGSLRTPIQPSVDCDICHSDAIYNTWRGSMMSQSGRDPVFWAAVSVANVDAPESGELCLRCHISTGWFAGRSHPSDGSALLQNDISNGVACNLCHRMVDPVPSASDEATSVDINVRDQLTMTIPSGYIGGAALIVDPDDNRRGPFTFGLNLPYHTAYQTDFFNSQSDAVTRSRICGSCHNVDNPVLQWDEARGQYWPNEMNTPAQTFVDNSLFPVERTFDEWLYSQYAESGVYAPQFAGMKTDGIVSACQDCHLKRSTGYAAEVAFNPTLRDCGIDGCLPEHSIVGGNTWIPKVLTDTKWRLNAIGDSLNLQASASDALVMLRKAATISVTMVPSGTNQLATVRVINHSGHKLPTGYPEGRQMWLNIKAYDDVHNTIYESGAYNFNTGTLIRDNDIKVYEVKQGMTPELAGLLQQPSGESFHFVLNNIVVKDNRIPPRGVLQTEYDQPGLRPVNATYTDGQYWDETHYILPGNTVRVLVTLYYQTASREYINFLRDLGGVDGFVLGELWQTSKSQPVVMAQSWVPNYVFYLPVALRVQ